MCDNKTMSDNEEKQYEFCGYGRESLYIVKITVAGGGMMNGNAYATVEMVYKSEEDYENEPDCAECYYCEYGKAPSRKYIGNKVIFAEDGDHFDVVEYDWNGDN